MKRTVTAIVCVILCVYVFSKSIEGVTGVSSMIFVGCLALLVIGAMWLDGFWRNLTTPDERSLRRRPVVGGFDTHTRLMEL